MNMDMDFGVDFCGTVHKKWIQNQVGMLYQDYQ